MVADAKAWHVSLDRPQRIGNKRDTRQNKSSGIWIAAAAILVS